MHTPVEHTHTSIEYVWDFSKAYAHLQFCMCTLLVKHVHTLNIWLPLSQALLIAKVLFKSGIMSLFSRGFQLWESCGLHVSEVQVFICMFFKIGFSHESISFPNYIKNKENSMKVKSRNVSSCGKSQGMFHVVLLRKVVS